MLTTGAVVMSNFRGRLHGTTAQAKPLVNAAWWGCPAVRLPHVFGVPYNDQNQYTSPTH